MASYESLVITKKIALILLGIGAFVCSILFASSEGNFLFDKVVVVFAVFAMLGLGCGLLLSNVEQKRASKLIAILNYRCDPFSYLEATEGIKLDRKKYSFSFDLMYCRVLSLLYICKKEEASRLISHMELPFYRDSKTISKKWMAMLLYDLAERTDEEILLQKCKTILKAPYKFNRGKRSGQPYLYYRNMEERERLEEAGDYQGLIEFFSRTIDETLPNDNRSRVEAYYSEAKIYERIGEKAAAEDAYKTVVELGNKLPYVKEALAALNKDDTIV